MRAAAYAVVDVETTGIDPGSDRVLEIAVVRLDGAARVVREYTTLVNPGCPVRATFMHGIRDRDVAGAPTFAEVGEAVAALLRGAVLVGHNLAFDRSFLAAEYGRLGVELPPWPGVCTLELARRFSPNGSHSLAACCKAAGIPLPNAHRALGDARATARLLAHYLELAREQGGDDLAALGCDPLVPPPLRWPTGLAYSRRHLPRSLAHGP